MINENVQDLHLNYPNFSEWMNNFDSVPYMLADVAYQSLVLKIHSFSYFKYESMPLCKTLPKDFDESQITEFFQKVLETVGDQLVKSIILDIGPEEFTKPDLPPELKAIERHSLVIDSTECFGLALQLQKKHGNKSLLNIFHWGYHINNSDSQGTYLKSYNWWETTAMQDLLFQISN